MVDFILKCVSLLIIVLIFFYFLFSLIDVIYHIKATRSFNNRVNDFENTSLDDIVKAYINLNK